MERYVAVTARKIIDEIEKNEQDINAIELAKEAGIVEAQVTFKCIGGTYNTKRYDNTRVDLLLRILKDRNNELLEQLSSL